MNSEANLNFSHEFLVLLLIIVCDRKKWCCDVFFIMQSGDVPVETKTVYFSYSTILSPFDGLKFLRLKIFVHMKYLLSSFQLEFARTINVPNCTRCDQTIIVIKEGTQHLRPTTDLAKRDPSLASLDVDPTGFRPPFCWTFLLFNGMDHFLMVRDYQFIIIVLCPLFYHFCWINCDWTIFSTQQPLKHICLWIYTSNFVSLNT